MYVIAPINFYISYCKKRRLFTCLIKIPKGIFLNIDKDFVMFLYFLHHICSNINDKKKCKILGIVSYPHVNVCIMSTFEK